MPPGLEAQEIFKVGINFIAYFRRKPGGLFIRSPGTNDLAGAGINPAIRAAKRDIHANADKLSLAVECVLYIKSGGDII